jgi:GTP-binding protein
VTKVVSAEWVATASGPEGYPTGGIPEVAFLGRSNVGKSSLLNRLVARKRLARTSGVPGKTRLLHFFRVERDSRAALLLVDLPGYGWARVPKSERAGWRTMIEGYLERRTPLRACVLLQDIRRDASDDETLLIAWLRERGIPVRVAITKIDKLKRGRRAQRILVLRRAFELEERDVIPTSAESGEGIGELWRAIDRLVGP